MGGGLWRSRRSSSVGSRIKTPARLLRHLLDPSAMDTMSLPRDVGELAQALDHHAVPLFDNLSRLSKWQADELSKAVPGGGFTKRELYTDSEDVLWRFRRAILWTGITVPT